MNKVPDNVGFIFWREKEKKKKKKKGLLWREWEGNEELFWKEKHNGLFWVSVNCNLHACTGPNPNTLRHRARWFIFSNTILNIFLI